MIKEIRNLQVNEKYILDDYREIYGLRDKEIFTEKQLEQVLFQYYDESEHWAILTNSHPNITLRIEPIIKIDEIEKLKLMQKGEKRSIVYYVNTKTGEAKILMIDNSYFMELEEKGCVNGLRD